MRLRSNVLVAAILALGASLALVPAPSQAQDVDISKGYAEDFGNWTVTCDPTLFCTAMGFANNDGIPDGALVLTQAPGRNGAFAAKLLITNLDQLQSITLDPPGFEDLVAGFQKSGSSEATVFELPGQLKGRLLEALAQDNFLKITPVPDDYREEMSIGLGFAADALAAIDRIQGRTGTPLALMSPGTAETAIPEAAPQPVVKAPMITLTRIMPDAALATQLQQSTCESLGEDDADEDAVTDDEGTDQDTGNAGGIDDEGMDGEGEDTGPQAYAMPDGREIWLVTCPDGAYMSQVSLFWRNGEQTELIAFPHETGTTQTSLTNAGVDTKDGFLNINSFFPMRGAGDCGDFTSYVWTGESFVLTHQTSMDACKGIAMEDWPVKYDAKIVER
jgi:hypothetical protein